MTLAFVILIFSGCNSANEPTGSLASTRTTQPGSSDAQLLTNLMIEHLGSAGTFAADFQEAIEFNMKFDGSTLHILTKSVGFIFAKTRTVWSLSGPTYYVGHKPLAKLPPVGLLKFLLFSRLVGNALHVAPHCRAENERTASNVFTIDSFPGKWYRQSMHEQNFRETIYACSFIDKGNRDCPGTALKVSLAVLLSEFFKQTHSRASSTIMRSFATALLASETDARRCPSQVNQAKFIAYFDQMTTLISEILRPSETRCLEEHYESVVHRMTDLDAKIRPNIDFHC